MKNLSIVKAKQSIGKHSIISVKPAGLQIRLDAKIESPEKSLTTESLRAR